MVGDTECYIESSLIIEWINLSLGELGKWDGLEKLFERHDTINLAGINSDGTPAAGWTLDMSDKPTEETTTVKGVVTGTKCTVPEMPTIIDIRSLRMMRLNTDGCTVTPVDLCYKEYSDFFVCNPMPEQNCAGCPRAYTIEQVGTDLKILFDRPPAGVVAIDMIYSAYPPELNSESDEIRIPNGYIDLVLKLTEINFNIASSDNSAAIALYESADKLINDAVQRLARRKSYQGFRTMKRGF